VYIECGVDAVGPTRCTPFIYIHVCAKEKHRVE